MKKKIGHIDFIPLKDRLDENNDVLWWTIFTICAIAVMLLTSIEVTGGYGK